MNTFNYISAMAQTSSSDNTNLFPFPFHVHLIFSIICVLFFLGIYGKQKKPYQCIMAFAVPLSLVIWLSEDKKVFYGVGIVELVLLAAAFIITIAGKIKVKKAAEAAKKIQEFPEHTKIYGADGEFPDADEIGAEASGYGMNSADSDDYETVQELDLLDGSPNYIYETDVRDILPENENIIPAENIPADESENSAEPEAAEPEENIISDAQETAEEAAETVSDDSAESETSDDEQPEDK